MIMGSSRFDATQSLWKVEALMVKESLMGLVERLNTRKVLIFIVVFSVF